MPHKRDADAAYNSRESLSPETQSQIRALCESIAQTEQLGEDVQEELRGHIEDKVLAYVTGAEPVSEDDALMLAKKHFGQPGLIKSLLQSAHPERVALGMGRRIAVAALASIAAGVITKVTLAAVGILGAVILDPLSCQYWLMVGAKLAGLTGFVALVLILRRARSLAHSGNQPWFARWSIGRFTAVFAFAMLVSALIPEVGYAFQPDSAVHEIRSGFLAFHIGAGLLIALALCLPWLWWCDQPPRTLKNLGVATAAWALYLSAEQFVNSILNFPVVLFSPGPFESGGSLFTGLGGVHTSIGVKSFWTESLSGRFFLTMPAPSGFALIALASLIGFLVYRLIFQRFQSTAEKLTAA